MRARLFRSSPWPSAPLTILRQALLVFVAPSLGVVLCPHHARAEVELVAAPVGGVAVPVGNRRVVCPGEQELSGWQVEAGGRRLRPPAKGQASRALVRVAQSLEACANQNDTLVAQAVRSWPQIRSDELTINVDTGRVDVEGLYLKDVALNWRAGEQAGLDVCRDVATLDKAGKQRCAFAVPRGLPADAGALQLILLPEGVVPGPQTAGYDHRGRRLNLQNFAFAPARIFVQDVFVPDASLDADAEEARVHFKHPEAVAQVSCPDATCEVHEGDLLVHGLRGSDESLETRVALRPHVYHQAAGSALGPLATPMLVLPLQRCPLSLASSPPLRNVGGQRVVFKVGGRCAHEDNLRYTLGGAQVSVVDRLATDDGHYVVVQAESGLGEDVTVTIQRRSRVVALMRVKTRLVPTVHARIELPGHGEIDFLPTNRDAEVLLPPLGAGASLYPVAMPGVYTVTPAAEGGKNYHVRGLSGTTGWVALRYAYRDTTLPGALAQLDLAHFSDTVDRSIHAASLPVSLGASVWAQEPLIELVCTEGENGNYRIGPAKPYNLDFRNKDSCRLVLHRERLRPEDGDQLIRVTVNVAMQNGINRPEAAIDQRVLFRPGHKPRYLYIGGVIAPYDRVVVRATVITQDMRGAVNGEESERLVMPQVQWSLIMGNNRLRLYATTSMPSGLFRVADPGHSGLLGLSAGILARLVVLSRQGVQSPIGLEIGTLVLGIAGDTTPAPHGQFALVGGLSLGVPVANVSRTTQAAINLHIWAEYEVSRRYIRNGGRPWGFVFGPSLSFGNIGLNL